MRPAPKFQHDAVVVGSGPNGLAAAVTLARQGLGVLVIERASQPGGGVRSGALTLPGFIHDICSSAYPLGAASPFFRSLPLERHGLAWIHPPACAAHPLPGGEAALLTRSLEETAQGLGRDAEAWRRLFGPLVESADAIITDILAPLHWPRRPLPLARFGLPGLRSARGLAESRFRTREARALLAGMAAHGTQPLENPATAGFALLFALLGHHAGWPLVAGGAQRLTEALLAELRALGGEIECGREISRLGGLPPSRAVLLDVTPRQFLRLGEGRLSGRERRRLERFRYGPGTFKVDWALAGPIPWAAPACARAGSVHIGGELEELAAGERTVAGGGIPSHPFVLLVQPSLFDPSRAPAGRHTAWGYCHLPNGSAVDLLDAIERRVEEFAPGFGDLVLGRHVLSPPTWEAHNPNCVGGDISGGAMDMGQLLTRPFFKLDPYATALPGVYLCSASTPPGGGVHGMGGYFAARSALRREFGIRLP